MIIIIAASSGKNLLLAQDFKNKFTELNLQSEIINLVNLELPLYSPIAEAKHTPAEVLGVHLDKIKSAAGFVFLSPEYNGGLPPVLTNFIAWVSRSSKDWREAFNSKPAIIGSYSGGNGLNLLSALRSQLAYIGITTIGRQVTASPAKALEIAALNDVCNQIKKLCQ